MLPTQFALAALRPRVQHGHGHGPGAGGEVGDIDYQLRYNTSEVVSQFGQWKNHLPGHQFRNYILWDSRELILYEINC